MTDKKRVLSQKIERLLQYFPAVIIIGARQVGKTALTKILRPAWDYLDLENPLDYDRITRDPAFYFAEHPEHVIFDEAQEYPELFQILRGEIDRHRNTKNRFLITGSSSPELMKNVSESLAGRAGIVELGTFKVCELYNQPLSHFYSLFESKLSAEFFHHLDTALTLQQVQQAWLKGGYPEPTLSRDSTFYKLWMENYTATYLNRDLKKLFPKLDTVKYRRFLNMLARLSGSVVVKSDLARALDISEPTVKDYIDIAHGTFVWRNLTSFEHSTEKSTVKMPRGHYRDSGLCHNFLKLTSTEEIENDPIVGKSFESFVIEEILKGLEASDTANWTAHYYRTKNGAEIDLVLEGEFGIVPIEVKYGLSIDTRKLKALKQFVKKHSLPFGILVNNSKKAEWISEKIIQIPAGCL